MDFGVCFILLLTACISYLIMTYARMLQKRGQLPPGPFPLPVVGNLLQVNTKNISQSLITISKKYGPVYTLYFGTTPKLVLCGYEIIKEALINQADQFSGRGSYPVFDNYVKGNDVAFSNGEKWKELRRFAVQSMRNFGVGKRSIEERIQEETQILIKELRKTNKSPFEPTEIIFRSISNVICSVLFGRRFDYEDKTLQTISITINENFKLISSSWGLLYNVYPEIMEYLPGPHKKIMENHEKLRPVFKSIIDAHQETLDPDNPRDYIDVFLIKMEKEKNNAASHFFMETLIMTMHTLLYGGTDTLTTTLKYSILILMKFPEVAEKVQDEIDQVIGQNRLPTTEDRQKMPYTAAVIHELQRFTDISPLGLPHLLMEDTQLQGYQIPKDTIVIPVLSSVHYDPTQYEKPETFNPGNFLDQNGSLKRNDALMPFSAGKRICPGEILARMQMFLLLTSLLQNFTFQPLGSREDIDLTPTGGSLLNIPKQYQCCAIPR